MTDKLKDAEDRLLDSLLRSEPIADEGFSQRVVVRIQRRIWLRRLVLPISIVIGSSIAVEPVQQLAAATSKLVAVLPQGFLEISAPWIPSMQIMVVGAMLLIAMMLSLVEE